MTLEDEIDQLKAELKEEKEAHNETKDKLTEVVDAMDSIYSIAKNF